MLIDITATWVFDKAQLKESMQDCAIVISDLDFRRKKRTDRAQGVRLVSVQKEVRDEKKIIKAFWVSHIFEYEEAEFIVEFFIEVLATSKRDINNSDIVSILRNVILILIEQMKKWNIYKEEVEKYFKEVGIKLYMPNILF